MNISELQKAVVEKFSLPSFIGFDVLMLLCIKYHVNAIHLSNVRGGEIDRVHCWLQADCSDFYKVYKYVDYNNDPILCDATARMELLLSEDVTV